MQLDRLIIETRVRSAWSAIDLGMALGRAFWLRSVCLYLTLVLPLYAFIIWILDDWSVLPYIILWWMKPLFERPILFLLSRELFSEPMSFWQVIRAFGLWFKPGLLWIMTIRRISFARGMYAPITLLERPDRKAYSRRVSTLGGKFSKGAFWLTTVLYHVESFMLLAIVVVCSIFAPESMDISDLLLNDTPTVNAFIALLTIFVMAGIAPFYVASGFMLYISRRVELEGWDIEICFRDWMTKYKSNLSENVQADMSTRL